MIDDIEYGIKAVNGRIEELRDSEWLSQVWQRLDSICEGDTVKSIRCLALGKVSEYVNPRFQLALLLLLARRLETKNITAWDPAFDETDRAILHHFDVDVVDQNPQSTDDILWYVPHGPFSLVSQLPSAVQKSIYIGNDLSSFDLDNKLDKEHIEAYKQGTRIVPLPSNKRDRWFTAFTNTAIHKKGN